MRRAILPLLVLLLLPAQVRAQPAYGAGNVNDASGKPVAARVTDAADSPSITAWTTLLTAFVAPNALGLPALALGVMGWDGVNMRVLSVSATGILGVDTELPAAAALTDADPNPTVPGVASYLMGWVPGGPAWERIRSSGTGAQHFDLQLVDGAQPAFAAGVVTANTFRGVSATAAAPETQAATAVAQAAGDTAVMVTSPAGATVFGACCQNRTAGQGAIVVAQGATTAVGTLGARLDPAPWVGGSGGSACWERYSGPLTGYTETVGATVTVSCWRW